MPGITPSNTYETREGGSVIIGANGDAIFRRFMQAIGRADLAEDPQLADNAGRSARADELYEVIGGWAASRELEEVLRICGEAEVPATRIYSVADMIRDPQFLARNMIETAFLPDGKALRVPGIVPKLSATPGGTEWLGPALGEHTEQVLERLGFSAEQVAALRRDGAI
jgi:formyl-CoA transferase